MKITGTFLFQWKWVWSSSCTKPPPSSSGTTERWKEEPASRIQEEKMKFPANRNKKYSGEFGSWLQVLSSAWMDFCFLLLQNYKIYQPSQVTRSVWQMQRKEQPGENENQSRWSLVPAYPEAEKKINQEIQPGYSNVNNAEKRIQKCKWYSAENEDQESKWHQLPDRWWFSVFQRDQWFK